MDSASEQANYGVMLDLLEFFDKNSTSIHTTNTVIHC